MLRRLQQWLVGPDHVATEPVSSAEEIMWLIDRETRVAADLKVVMGTSSQGDDRGAVKVDD